jgi:hypothetical protein
VQMKVEDQGCTPSASGHGGKDQHGT